MARVSATQTETVVRNGYRWPWLAQWVEHVTQSQGCKFELHIAYRNYLKTKIFKYKHKAENYVYVGTVFIATNYF